MPLEIRELVIKATVDQEGGNAQGGTANGSNSDTKEAEVNLIVEKVLAILKEKSER
ncbi:MAG: hypothetical protein HUU34_06100 [Saprospiraceae bacterium]|nr:hypothetical protein [Saprospiraceae bacterium]